MAAGQYSKMGTAYAFFACDASRTAIESELHGIRQMSNTPSDLELSLIEGPENVDVSGDAELEGIAKDAQSYGFQYAVVARCPDKDNRYVGGELGDVMNSMYASDLYQEGAPFRGAVFAEENGNYQELQ